MSGLGIDPDTPTGRHLVGAYTVKRLERDRWQIWHAGELVCSCDYATAIRFSCGQIDPASLASEGKAQAAAWSPIAIWSDEP
jgi:hypothetical protein